MVSIRRDLTKQVFIALVIVLYFLYLNNPFAEIQEMANSNLLLIGALGFLIFGIGTDTFYPITNKKDLISDAAIGILTGLGGVVLIGLILKGTQGVFNLSGSIMPASIASFTMPEQVLIIATVQPLTETIILIGGALFLYKVLKNLKSVPYPKVLAGLTIIILFAAFHFNAIGSQFYEYSPAGFINFIGNTTNLSQSAFPQMLMGLFWVFLGFAFRSWIVPAFAHIMNNTVSLYGSLGTDPIVLSLFLFFGVIVFIVWQKTKFSEFSSFKLREAVS